jgi:predicted nucleic acid-binding Zn ribbon protein
MDCPQCGTWNADDRTVCWRCNTELPKPKKEPKRRRGLAWSPRTWWLIILAILVLWIVMTCLLPALLGGQSATGP